MKTEAEVIVVGAGPGGAAAARYLAVEGFDVIALEKSHYPREKVCGDGLTPRAVKELQLIGLETPRDEGWIPNHGLRMVGGGHRLEFPWHDLESFPNFGLSLPRAQFDHRLAQHARAAGADVREGWHVDALIIRDADGEFVVDKDKAERAAAVRPGGEARVVGVVARETDEKGRKVGDPVEYRAPLIISADGVSGRLALGLGIERKVNRPMGVAVRTYIETPRHAEEWMEGHLEIWDGERGNSKLLPGYGWIFPLGDGTANVGLGTLSAKGTPSGLDHRGLMRDWLDHSAQDWEFGEQVGPIKGAAIPMAFNRQPHYVPGMMLVGDSGGMVNPFNGEGIAYAMQAARRATEAAVGAREAGDDAVAAEKALAAYARMMKDDLGGYYSLGRVFATLIEHPTVMSICTKYGLPRPLVMDFVSRLLADVYEPRGGAWSDKLLSALIRVSPAA
ncbi:geranylgeranyl reductase family protein [Demequina zhanjiangensis]|uniref:Geranylgeranyl reductase family protein n=1 Tax=Demequina zhanjiangensis TaxID=3051659 RepID=A0ABT8FWY3_9MICO|nr:geranylgeranyl reductase family protein [Demequina sp. SYSU T00b26]MDN4471403.1 geranylgeranyl reductase family protein [Demequina sp. SYSU T00b26]